MKSDDAARKQIGTFLADAPEISTPGIAREPVVTLTGLLRKAQTGRFRLVERCAPNALVVEGPADAIEAIEVVSAADDPTARVVRVRVRASAEVVLSRTLPAGRVINASTPVFVGGARPFALDRPHLFGDRGETVLADEETKKYLWEEGPIHLGPYGPHVDPAPVPPAPEPTPPTKESWRDIHLDWPPHWWFEPRPPTPPIPPLDPPRKRWWEDGGLDWPPRWPYGPPPPPVYGPVKPPHLDVLPPWRQLPKDPADDWGGPWIQRLRRFSFLEWGLDYEFPF